MAKPVLYYALTRSYLSDFEVLGVTSEKGGQVYGRRQDDSATHVSRRDVLHVFEPGTSPAFALAARERASAARKMHEPKLREARELLDRLRAACDRAVLDAAKGIPPKVINVPARTST